MSPITTAAALGDGHPGPEPRFVLTSCESPRPSEAPKSQCSSLSDGENYECYGDGPDADLDSGIVSDRIVG